MQIVIEILRASLIGSVLFTLLLGLRLSVGKHLSGGFHYYSRLIPLAFYLGATMFCAPIIALIAKMSTSLNLAGRKPNNFTRPIEVEKSSISSDIVDSFSAIKIHLQTTTAQMDFTLIINCIFVTWTIGIIVFLLYKLFCYRKFKTFLISHSTNFTQNVQVKKGVAVRLCESITTPVLLGIKAPTIFLPKLQLINMNEKELSMILAHELTHVKRRDLLYKLVALIANAVHWFNPLAYSLTRELNQLCERSCDEKLVCDMSMDNRKFYGKMILDTLERGKLLQMQEVSASFCGSKKNIEGRIKNIMKFKKMKGKTKIAAIMITVFVFAIGSVSAYALNTSNTKIDSVDSVSNSNSTVDSQSIPTSEPEKTDNSEVPPTETEDKTVNLISPIEYDRITSEFGWRNLFGEVSFYRGIGLAADLGTDITAADDGTVTFASFDKGNGMLVKIMHADSETETEYAHCSKLLVKKGDVVKQGDVIAEVGSTGHSTGNHLLFTVTKRGVAIDPSSIVK